MVVSSAVSCVGYELTLKLSKLSTGKGNSMSIEKVEQSNSIVENAEHKGLRLQVALAFSKSALEERPTVQFGLYFML